MVKNNKKTIAVSSKIATWLIVLMPILTMYRSIVPQVEMGTFLCVLCTPYFLYVSQRVPKAKIDGKVRSTGTVFFLYSCVTTFLAFFIGKGIIGNLLDGSEKALMLFRLLRLMYVYIFCLYLIFPLVNREYLFSAMRTVTFLAVIYIILQTLVFYLFGRVLPPFINILTKENYSRILSAEYHKSLGLFRPMSFFYEPAHFSEYAIIYLCFALFGKRKKPDTFGALFVTAGILLSTSGVGIMAAVFVWGCCFFCRVFRAENTRLKQQYLCLLCLFVVCIPVVLSIEIFRNAFLRLLSPETGGAGAATIRIFPGYVLFQNMSMFNKLFGIGFGNTFNGPFLNGFVYLLIGGGIVGVILFVRFFVAMYRYATGAGRVLAASIIIMIFMADIVNWIFGIYMVMVLASGFRQKELCITKVCETVSPKKDGSKPFFLTERSSHGNRH